MSSTMGKDAMCNIGQPGLGMLLSDTDKVNALTESMHKTLEHASDGAWKSLSWKYDWPRAGGQCFESRKVENH